MKKTPIGKLLRIRRYPVKSMAGEDTDTSYIHETGLNGDRIYAFYDYNSKRQGLPYLTIREKRQMLLMKARIINETNSEKPYHAEYKPQVEITLDGNGIPVDDERILNHLKTICAPKHQNITLDYRKAGIQDTLPVSLVSIQSLHKLAEELGKETIDPLRFRENFYVDWNNGEAFYEEKLVGKSVQIGNDVILHIVKSNIRCPIIGVDPQTAENDVNFLRTVSRLHDIKFGIYGNVRNCGVVRNDDTIYLIE